MNKHTPGPWTARTGLQTKHLHYVTDSEGRTICDTDDGYCTAPESHEQVEANARLIAAAPNLLTALKQLLSAPLCHRDDDTIEDANAIANGWSAIQDATGVYPEDYPHE